MSATSERPADPVAFNPFVPGFAEDPYPQYAALRAQDPVHLSPVGFWILTRYDDVLRVLRDPALSVEERYAKPGPLAELFREAAGDRYDRPSRAMLNLDPPDHTRLRRLVSKAFTPRMVEGLRPRITALVDQALEQAGNVGAMDVVSELAFPLPFAVITEMLGMPDTDRAQLRGWSHLVVKSLDPIIDPAELPEVFDAADHMRAFVLDAIEAKRRNLADDLLSGLIAAEEAGDRLSTDELLEQVVLLYIAGHETTVNLIGNGVLALLRNPDQLARLRQHPELDPIAVDELLRYDSPVQISRRITIQDLEIGGRRIEAGSFVATCLASANRDEAHWGPSADRLDVGREGAAQHVAFGGGAHHCLGAALARLEGQVAIGSLIRRFPGLALAGDPVWNGRINLRGLDRLPVDLGSG